jgi:hypothetical protein
MGKAPKMAIFADFGPVSLKTEKNEIAYHAGNIFSKMFSKFVFRKK